jgi:hypothetical protein
LLQVIHLPFSAVLSVFHYGRSEPGLNGEISGFAVTERE